MGSYVLSNTAKTTADPVKNEALVKELECVSMLFVIVSFQNGMGFYAQSIWSLNPQQPILLCSLRHGQKLLCTISPKRTH